MLLSFCLHFAFTCFPFSLMLLSFAFMLLSFCVQLLFNVYCILNIYIYIIWAHFPILRHCDQSLVNSNPHKLVVILTLCKWITSKCASSVRSSPRMWKYWLWSASALRSKVDAWVQVACPRLSMDWGSSAYSKPMLPGQNFWVFALWLVLRRNLCLDRAQADILWSSCCLWCLILSEGVLSRIDEYFCS